MNPASRQYALNNAISACHLLGYSSVEYFASLQLHALGCCRASSGMTVAVMLPPLSMSAAVHSKFRIEAIHKQTSFHRFANHAGANNFTGKMPNLLAHCVGPKTLRQGGSSSVANPVAVFLGVSVLRCFFCDVLLGAGPTPVTHHTVSYRQTENGNADEP
jgi:hypothetical protein